MRKLEIKGRFSGKGEAEGKAIVVPKSFGFWGATDQKKGVITDKWNPARGESFAHRVLVIPSTKGSSGNWISLVICCLNGVGPKAIISHKGDPLLVGACIELGIPYVFDLDKNPLELIRTGDYLKISVPRQLIEIE